jgi:hypothetical protein
VEGLGTIIDDKGMFWHNGGNVGFRSLYVGDQTLLIKFAPVMNRSV